MPVLNHPFLRDGIEARGYQIEATQACIRCSTLLVMPTGFGKTAVQWNCIADALDDGIEKIVITAPTVGLVEQQRRMILERIQVDEAHVSTYTGSDRPVKRGKIWEDAVIIIATPQVIRNDVDSGLINLNNVGLLIIDEAHHSTGERAEAQVADLYLKFANDPLILGMTASPGSNMQKVEEICNRLQVGRIHLRTSEDDMLSEHLANLEIEELRVRVPNEIRELVEPFIRWQETIVERERRLGRYVMPGAVTHRGLANAMERANLAVRRGQADAYGSMSRIGPVSYTHLTLPTILLV